MVYFGQLNIDTLSHYVIANFRVRSSVFSRFRGIWARARAQTFSIKNKNKSI